MKQLDDLLNSAFDKHPKAMDLVCFYIAMALSCFILVLWQYVKGA